MMEINLMFAFKIICLIILGSFLITFFFNTFKQENNSFIGIVIGFLAFALPFTYICIK